MTTSDTGSVWWERLETEEKDLLIELLYRLPLEDYIKIGEDGSYLALLS